MKGIPGLLWLNRSESPCGPCWCGSSCGQTHGFGVIQTAGTTKWPKVKLVTSQSLSSLGSKMIIKKESLLHWFWGDMRCYLSVHFPSLINFPWPTGVTWKIPSAASLELSAWKHNLYFWLVANKQCPCAKPCAKCFLDIFYFLPSLQMRTKALIWLY